MDNKKIGNLIASLRKAKGLTQQELGDMVGIGFRAVSKWERGITMPDISIINDLSKILGITSDELLSGEVKEINIPKENKKSSKTIKITISILTTIILIITSITIYLNNKTYMYEITHIDGADYHIEGEVIFKKNKMSLTINKLMFLDNKFSSTIIKNYSYEIYSEEKYLFGYGYDPNAKTIKENLTIEEFSENFRINSHVNIELKRKEIIEKTITLTINFFDKENQIITKEIKCTLY